jgi:rhodanese-related sulfurtransferase
MQIAKPITILLALSLTVGLGACSRAESLDNTGKAAVNQGATQQGSITNVSNAELQKLLDQGVTLVDIRRPEEWQETGVIAGSQRLTLFTANGSVAPNFLSDLEKAASRDKPVALICRTGNRTRAGSEMVAQAGYGQVYNVTKGITGWIAEGRAVTR